MYIIRPSFILIVIFSFNLNGQKLLNSGNPIIEDWYADPEITILNNTYWLFPTFSGVLNKQDFLDGFSSKDLVHWNKHEKLLSPKNIGWVTNELWAPAAIEKDNNFYIFFSANDIQTPESKWWDAAKHDSTEVGGIGIAVSQNPEGPYFDYLGKPLIGKVHNRAQPIDQFVFEDVDGTYYIIYGGWNHCNIAKLNEAFNGFIPFDDGTIFKEITPENYVEGPVMFRKNNKYYLMWSEGSWGKENYKVAYGIAKTPLGPFDRISTVLESDTGIATGAGHNSVLNIPNTDDWVIAYHRRPIPNQHTNHRVVCLDKMEFNTDGTIKPIQMTFKGVGEIPLFTKEQE